ncbi:acyl-CoA dehydrogenase family protein [bacterium]|jgi:alkylation response protein AidB-like acyl-CoA dehydrogenase|nr:acyl-CoA dehydrogenase family protein [bacterium]
MTEFFQDGPVLKNQYDDDPFLRFYLRKTLPPKTFNKLEPDLRKLGNKAATSLLNLGKSAEQNPPRHVPYDAWGHRIDEIETSEAWKELEKIAAQEGLVSIGYERKQGGFSRVHQFAKIYLYGPSSAIFTCPLAMTDGAARAVELYGDDEMKKNVFAHLTSRNPRQFFTSGQWMTERTGGSDVSGTSTIAKKVSGNQYKLFGTKWFTSATTSHVAMALARIEGAPEGSKGLSLFCVRLRDEKGALQGIRIHRLKEKLGTRALPTAELTLDGAPATLVGDEGNGVKKISSLFNITRIWNASSALGYMRRGVALAKDYSTKRRAFGKLIAEHPLHQETLAAVETEWAGAFHLVFRVAELLGKEEVNEATPSEKALLRLLTPVVKLFTAKQGVSVASEVLECFGGAGYIEDTGLPSLLRDSQVLAIWEGTTNVLSLDMLRALDKEKAMGPFVKDVNRILTGIQSKDLQPLAKQLKQVLVETQKWSEHLPEVQARKFAFQLARIYSGALLVEYADWCQKNEKLFVKNSSSLQLAMLAAKRWCAILTS